MTYCFGWKTLVIALMVNSQGPLSIPIREQEIKAELKEHGEKDRWKGDSKIKRIKKIERKKLRLHLDLRIFKH